MLFSTDVEGSFEFGVLSKWMMGVLSKDSGGLEFFHEKFFRGFGSNFGWIWVYMLGVKCMCFRKHRYS